MYLDRKPANQSPEKVLFLYFKSLSTVNHSLVAGDVQEILQPVRSLYVEKYM
jgi:hypothetical protein